MAACSAPADGIIRAPGGGDTSAVPWDELVAEMTARHPLTPGKMFGLPCLKRANGKIVAGLWKDGGLTVKLVDETEREQALAIPGASAFDPGMGRTMREWVHVPAEQSARWAELVDQAV